jgi:NAD(P)-dependent dehydrogenase (short-subunit alcohol dehydrogenase family)
MAFSFGLQGKTALITGASSGLGEHFAGILAAEGVAVALAARSVDKLEALKAEIEGRGGRAYTVRMDVKDVKSIRAAVDEIEAKFAPIDVLVNNSGISTTVYMTDVEEQDYDDTLDTNARGAFFVAQAVARRMIAAKRPGRIINIASAIALKSLSLLGTYAMSKAAVTRMTQTMALEWLRYNITVNAICPGYIVTGINRDYFASPGGQKLMDRLPRKRVGPPESLDGILLLLASDRSEYINGAIIPVDDGTVIS